MSHWSNKYIGLPSGDGCTPEGLHCWGLAVLVYAEQLGLELPTYAGRYTSIHEEAEVAALIAGEKDSPIWLPVLSPAPFDIVTFRQAGVESHMGVVVRSELMLHVSAGEQVRIESYAGGRWAKRLTGIYRHVKAPLQVTP